MKIYFGLKHDWNVTAIIPIFKKLDEDIFTTLFFENRQYGNAINEVAFGINVLEYDSYDNIIPNTEKMIYRAKSKSINFQIFLNYEKFVKGDNQSNIEQLIEGFQGCFSILLKRSIKDFDAKLFQKYFFLFLVSREFIDSEAISW
ncbi:Imm44 family immunity protein [Arcicella sp. LKC2W]|uniref:Imm44 family immunity protein n=1 Tax=Arcicella sp. LKC2W TaxID=2984198 RepID=UPI002B1EC441|nr:Imm44 family immunity protein [Arcicella sp. LKC2W]MEA5458233.1 Imm44 family immunity protein [Arcicella sp. LKC2W]